MVRLKFGSLRKQNIINLTSYELDNKENFALSLVQNFSVPPKKINREELYLGFEKLFEQVTTQKPRNLNEAISFKANITVVGHNYCKMTADENLLAPER